MDSKKAWQSTVGHEIAHVLEGSEHYEALKTALFDYAESKGEYQSKYDSISELYKNVPGANIEAELTAELVGEYLFTDEAFVKQLSSKNRSVFEKIYDEIKYLLKVATTGSKEARQLERIKHEFDLAYKESSVAKIENTKYSINENVIDKSDSDIDNYTEKEYNSYGWARYNDVLSASENADLRSKFAAAVSKQSKPPRTKSGEYMIAIGDNVHNKIAYMKGTIDDPYITRILEFDENNETELDKARRDVYAIERRGIQQEAGGAFHTYTAATFANDKYQFGSNAQGTRSIEQFRSGGSGNSKKAPRVKEYIFGENGSVTEIYADAKKTNNKKNVQFSLSEAEAEHSYLKSESAYNGNYAVPLADLKAEAVDNFDVDTSESSRADDDALPPPVSQNSAANAKI